MAILSIRQALETALKTTMSSFNNAQFSWENMDFTGVGGTPYADISLLPAEPENPSFGGHRERGILQVVLKYPLGTGPAAAAAQAELLQTAFDRGQVFISNGVRVQIEQTPQVMPFYNEEDRYCLPVRIRYFANV